MMCRFWCLFVLSLAICTNIGYGWNTNWDDPFQFTCPRGESLSQVESKHDNFYEDRIWKFGCRYTLANIVPSCRWSGKYCIKGGRGYVNNWDRPFTYQCPHNYFVAGMSGIHDNFYEDRRFQFYCCKKSEFQRLDSCYYTQRTTYDSYINITVPKSYVMRGVISEHNNFYEDRIFTFELCHLH